MATDGGPQTVHQIDLSFVSDKEVRKTLYDYYRQASLACYAGAYIGSIALSGGVLEGLLTWALSLLEEDARRAYFERFKKRPRPLAKWKLSELIEVSIMVGFLGKKAQKTAEVVKDFRNYIHPYNARESSWAPDEALALIALRLVDKISDSLRNRLPRSADQIDPEVNVP